MRRAIAVLASAAALVAVGAAAPPAQAVTVCTWAGTALEPTGWFTLDPPITTIPSATALKFRATGPLGGDPRCEGTMKFVGEFDAGASCWWSTFEAKVKGLPGVARVRGAAPGLLPAPSVLYDREGNLVGHEQAHIVTQENLHTFQSLPCETEGLAGATFYSVVVLWGPGW